MESLAKIAQYSAELMRKIMGNPSNINTQEVIALSEGTTMLKRYIEFICLREVKIPQFLLDTLNRLELALGKPLTQEGQHIETLLDCILKFSVATSPVFRKVGLCASFVQTVFTKLLKLKKSLPWIFKRLNW